MPTDSDARSALRRQLRGQRKTIEPARRTAAALAAAEHISGLPHWSAAYHIGLYWPNDGELDTRPLADACRNEGKRVYLPVLTQHHTLTFREWREDSSLQNNRYGIPEPTAQADAIAVPEIDVVVMPLVGWQRDGYRLGMGGGFYDRTLADAGGPLRVGLAYACQEIRGLAMQHWDVALQWVLTENGLVPCSQQPRERLTSR